MIYISLKNRDEDDNITLKDAFLQYSLITNSMFIYAQAAISALLKRYIGFVVTNKTGQKTGFREIKWNILLAAVCFGFSIFGLYQTMTAGSVEQIRTYLPISLWMLFYTVILGSSIFFVGDGYASSNTPSITPNNTPISHKSRSKSQGTVAAVSNDPENMKSLRSV